VTASVHDVNERRLCKISEEVEKFFALAILFCGAARIEERFLASPRLACLPACLPAAGRLGMATAQANKKKEGGHGAPCPTGKIRKAKYD
jgi:hypothetical protein